jgi:hypothetical protein
VKRSSLFAALTPPRLKLEREGAAHSLWSNPATGAVEAIPRHTEIPNILARKICRTLSVPEPGRE